jgi:hypothetical protein
VTTSLGNLGNLGKPLDFFSSWENPWKTLGKWQYLKTLGFGKNEPKKSWEPGEILKFDPKFFG